MTYFQLHHNVRGTVLNHLVSIRADVLQAAILHLRDHVSGVLGTRMNYSRCSAKHTAKMLQEALDESQAPERGDQQSSGDALSSDTNNVDRPPSA
jgi:5,10-methenyltetrahydromethanopterin hydrogenase